MRAEAAETTEFSPAEGVPGDVAKVLLSTARSGLRAVHLVAGDPFEHESVVKEVQAAGAKGFRGAPRDRPARVEGAAPPSPNLPAIEQQPEVPA